MRCPQLRRHLETPAARGPARPRVLLPCYVHSLPEVDELQQGGSGESRSGPSVVNVARILFAKENI